jgi:hypothetical protein
MHATNPRQIFQTLFQNEVFLITPILNAGSRCSRHVSHGNQHGITVFKFFVQNRKNYLMFYTFNYKTTVDMLFCILWALSV